MIDGEKARERDGDGWKEGRREWKIGEKMNDDETWNEFNSDRIKMNAAFTVHIAGNICCICVYVVFGRWGGNESGDRNRSTEWKTPIIRISTIEIVMLGIRITCKEITAFKST